MGTEPYTYACIVIFCTFFIQNQWKLRGRGNGCDKKGKILHGASVNKPSNTIHNETSCGTDDEIQRTSHDAYFSG
jgi:hypothetical protein